MIFVFGSNESGHHGRGAAMVAMKQHGAQYGVGIGPMGRSYAIPTKDWRIEKLPLDVVAEYVRRFIVFARMNPTHNFQITQIGCGLAGFTKEQIAPLFKYAPTENCFIDEAWQELLPNHHCWGTYPAQ